jgi:hypothetical protein
VRSREGLSGQDRERDEQRDADDLRDRDDR